jgi:hypothetical protein
MTLTTPKALFSLASRAAVVSSAALLVACGGGSGSGTVACSAAFGFLVSDAACKKNDAPVANAGPLQNVNTGTPVSLDGSKSRDANNDSLTYKWTLSIPLGSTAKLTADNIANPKFTVDVPGSYVATLVVNDGKLGSTPSTTTVVASIQNSAPVADAGLGRTVGLGLVKLDGSASSDRNDDMLTFKWALIGKPAGSNATIANAWSPVPSFTADELGNYVVTLVVNDGKVDSAVNAITITAVRDNRPPEAKAGANQNVKVTDTVFLDATSSFDDDNDFLRYTWKLISMPENSRAELQNSTKARPNFTADLPGTYVATLVANDGKVDSAIVATTITASAANSAPVAKLSADQMVSLGKSVTLDGSPSTDRDMDTLAFKWTLSYRPQGSTATLSSLTSDKPTLTPDLQGLYVATLIVSDGKLDSLPVSTSVAAAYNTLPIANPGLPQAVIAGAGVTLSGRLSVNTSNNPLSYAWTLVTKPAGSAAVLSGASTPNPTLITDLVGDYSIRLVVTSDGIASLPSEVAVKAVAN